MYKGSYTKDNGGKDKCGIVVDGCYLVVDDGVIGVDGAVDETVDDDDYVFTQCCMYLNGETTIVLFAW